MLGVKEISSLLSVQSKKESFLCQNIVNSLRDDAVVLVEELNIAEAEAIISQVAAAFGLQDSLKIQAGFATMLGHRKNINELFMTVNNREDYQFISAHSEGSRRSGIQFASFYCMENDTDGGDTILFNVDNNSGGWANLKELVKKVDIGSRKLTLGEISILKMRYKIFVPEDVIGENDTIVRELPPIFGDIKLFEVLTKVDKSFSKILNRQVHSYWDTVSSIDYSCVKEYISLLHNMKLLRMPIGGMKPSELDNCDFRRIWESGVMFKDIFQGIITRKLRPGDLIIYNNLTWAHSAANWTPGSGTRNIIAAFG